MQATMKQTSQAAVDDYADNSPKSMSRTQAAGSMSKGIHSSKDKLGQTVPSGYLGSRPNSLQTDETTEAAPFQIQKKAKTNRYNSKKGSHQEPGTESPFQPRDTSPALQNPKKSMPNAGYIAGHRTSILASQKSQKKNSISHNKSSKNEFAPKSTFLSSKTKKLGPYLNKTDSQKLQAVSVKHEPAKASPMSQTMAELPK